MLELTSFGAEGYFTKGFGSRIGSWLGITITWYPSKPSAEFGIDVTGTEIVSACSVYKIVSCSWFFAMDNAISKLKGSFGACKIKILLIHYVYIGK